MERRELPNKIPHNGDSNNETAESDTNMPIAPKPSVVRRLFPEDDFDMQASRENSLNMLKDLISADVARMRDKWNYDVENDRPLDGSVRWEKGDDRYNWIGFISAGSYKDNCENGEVIENKADETDGEECKTAECDRDVVNH